MQASKNIEKLIVKKYKLEKGIYIYQVIWNPNRLKKEGIVTYERLRSETIYLTKTNAPAEFKTLKGRFKNLLRKKSNYLLTKKDGINLDTFEILSQLDIPTSTGYEYNYKICMHNPIVKFNQILTTEEASKQFIQKRVTLSAAQNISGKYQNLAQFNTDINSCYITVPDNHKLMSQAQIERWIIANKIDPSEYPRLMEMFGYYHTPKETMKLTRAIRR